MARNSDIYDTLDALLCKHFHKTTPAPEASTCLTVFIKKCKTNSINADNYKDNYMKKQKIGKYANTQTNSGYAESQSNGSTRYYNQSTNYDFWGNAWDEMFRESNKNTSRMREEEERRDRARREADQLARKRKMEKDREDAEIKRTSEAHRKRQEREESEKRSKPGEYEFECVQGYVKQHGTIRACIFEPKLTNIVFSAEIQCGNRWGLENFIFYCGGGPVLTVETLNKYKLFRFVSNGNTYAGKLNINRIWGVDLEGKEHNIY